MFKKQLKVDIGKIAHKISVRNFSASNFHLFINIFLKLYQSQFHRNF